MAAADRQLLFGLLALQTGIINQGQLMLAFQAWTLDKSRSLADHLEARGDLNGAKRGVLDALAAVHLETHGGSAERSLAAVPSSRSTRASLAALGEPDIEATLARISRSPRVIRHRSSSISEAFGAARPSPNAVKDFREAICGI